ncbi:MAG: tetratricopeptide repeat protein [Nitrospirota bacterium]
MHAMHDQKAEALFTKGLNELHQGHTLAALASFERALQIEDNPDYYSYLAYCVAKERGQIRKAISLCEEAIQKSPHNPVHYLNLGRVYLHAQNKEYAVVIFREGLKYEKSQEIIDELNRLHTRKPPVLPFLPRDNPFNKYLGIVLRILRIR